ncbi:MAG: sodium ion-translocating decarboxylase subunit beta [Syntrophomonadaceae bacterium]|nr:sodium ion-translocating decarboxylase subunit beta [Syntrophomonadaceae bacterium]
MDQLLIGITGLTWKHLVMFGVGIILIYLAIVKEYEPVLLLPIGFGALLTNIPFSSAVGPEGPLTILKHAGIITELFPCLIFVAVGAMCDFAPMLKNPVLMLFGAAAQFGIFATIVVAALLGFDLKEAASIGIIGAADGPTTIYVATKFAPHLLGPLSVAAYSYMSLVPIIQPPVIRALTTRKERSQFMPVKADVPVSKTVRIVFPILVTLVAGIIAPISVALVGMLMLGNLLRECGVVERLSRSASEELANVVTLLLGITIGATMDAESFMNWKTIMVMGLGIVAFIFDTAGGVLFAKVLNLFLKEKINPMIGACGISAFPMSSRVVAKMALAENKRNYIIMHAVGANVSGQLGSIIAGGLVLAVVAGIVM